MAWLPKIQAQAVDDGAEVLTRGPVHEAFAGIIAFKSTPGILVPKAPPAVVDELPPEQRPEGTNVTWIPGYWSWDEETSGFIWVSGIWRNLPPGRQWIPGYWSESGQDYQWISGYWADATVEDVEYLDEPPASLEAGPNIKAPSQDYTWIPGNWRWQNSGYAWQGGYWDEVRPDWVWVPSYYTSTPRGYIYVDGYYDYDVPRRGMIFAPVRFYGAGYSQPGYYYRPTLVISLNAVLDHLFVRPRSRHYYFGDYYDQQYRGSGYYPSNQYYSGGYGYDPIYAHRRWNHRNEDGWERRYEDNFTFYRDHREERPPHTLAALSQFFSRPDDNRRVGQDYAQRLDQYAGRRDSKLKNLSESERQGFAQRGRELRDFGDLRRKAMAGGQGPQNRDRDGKAGGNKKNSPPESDSNKRFKIPKSPVVAQGREGRESKDTPPERSGRSRPSDTRDRKEELSPRPGKDQEKGDSKDFKPRGGQDAPPDSPKRDPKATPDQEGPQRKVPKPEPERETKPEPRREEPKMEPKREPGAEPRRESPKQEPKAEPRRESPKQQPKAEPRRESPKQQPKAEPRREAPKQQPKAEPRREQPKREPKAEPRQQPKAPPQAPSPSKKGSGNPDEKQEKDKKGKG